MNAFDNVSINLNFETKNGSRFNNIIKFGINNNATDGYDAHLKENDIPGHPPGNLHAFMKFYDDNQQSNINSYIDYRAIPEKDTFHIRYLVSVRFESNDTLIIKWNNISNIQTATFLDKFNGMFYKIDMLMQDSIMIDNSAFDEFYIDIYYDKFTTVVENNLDEIDFLFHPNPFYDKLQLSNNNMIKKLEIYDNSGRLASEDLNKVNNLKNGIYFVKIYDLNDNIQIKKIIKGK